MFLRPKESLCLSIYTLKRCMRISTSKDFHLTHCRNLRKVSPGRRKVSNVVEYESTSVAGEFPVNIAPKNVNENFFGIESDEGVIQINSKPSLNNNAKRQFLTNVEQEKLITTTYGTVRYDSQNIPKHHGQLEKENVKVSSILEKHKIHNLSETLQSKTSVDKHNLASKVDNNSMKITEMSNKNAELTSSSYVDELYFPEVYIEKEKTDHSRLETTPTTFNNDKVNFIEESYFDDKKTTETNFKITDIPSKNSSMDNLSFVVHETPTEFNGNNNSSTFHPTAGFKSVKSTSKENKSNFIEDSYFMDKLPDEPNIKNFNVKSTNIDNTDENNHYLTQEKSTKCITEDKQSNVFDDYHFNTISDGNFINMDKRNLDSDTKIVDTTEIESTDQENVTFNTTNLSSVQETETNIKPLHKVNETTKEEIDIDDNDDQSAFQLNKPSLAELEGYNKFLPDATQLSKKKNSFLFQSKKFLKGSELINSNISRTKKLISAQKNLDETDSAEKNQNTENVIKIQQKTQNVNVRDPNTNEQPETAYDFVKKLRNAKKKSDPELINGKFIQKTEKYDSKGFRILKNQVPELKYYTRDEILDLLTKNILYSDDDLIVLNKPYNLVMHESKTVKDACLSKYLDDLAAELDKKNYKPKLITVHRLDKETCGCLLLARNEISAQRLLSLFAQRKIVKTYWIVTTRVPEPAEGIIDMPISEGSVGGRSRMVLHPNLPEDIQYQNHSKSGKRAVTHYKVIAESGNAALVEAKPETGIKHQIRVHFGFGLSSPILGDHKYSHLDKLVPQKLQADLLQRLHVRQSKVRHIPMHIYARSILIPQYSEGRNLFVMAPMPIHMSKNLQKLKFRKN